MTFPHQPSPSKTPASVDAFESLATKPSTPLLSIDKPIRFIDNAAFRDADAWERFVDAPLPAAPAGSSQRSEKRTLSDELSALVAAPILLHEQEKHLFLKMNFLKHEAEGIRQEIASGRREISAAIEAEMFLEHATEVRNQIVVANMKLVIFAAKNTSRRQPRSKILSA